MIIKFLSVNGAKYLIMELFNVYQVFCTSPNVLIISRWTNKDVADRTLASYKAKFPKYKFKTIEKKGVSKEHLKILNFNENDTD